MSQIKVEKIKYSDYLEEGNGNTLEEIVLLMNKNKAELLELNLYSAKEYLSYYSNKKKILKYNISVLSRIVELYERKEKIAFFLNKMNLLNRNREI